MGDPLPGDPVRGWRPRTVRHLHATPQLDLAVQAQTRTLERGEVDPNIVRNVSFAGQFRIHRLAELVSPDWFQGDYYRTYYQGMGYHDALWAGVPISQDAESYFGLYRGSGQPPFADAELDAVLHALRGLRWFLRQQMLGHGLLVATTPLTSVERSVLHGLLTGRSEKQIADDQRQRHTTTHEYVTRIYRKYGVNNRASLMALWLGHGASAT